MEYITETLMGVLAAISVAAGMALRTAWPILRDLAIRWARELAERELLHAQERLAGGASRVAGELLMRAEAAGLPVPPPEMIKAGVEEFRARYHDTLVERKTDAKVPEAMVLGELAKLVRR
jgi:hypothetical protein